MLNSQLKIQVKEIVAQDRQKKLTLIMSTFLAISLLASSIGAAEVLIVISSVNRDFAQTPS
jgi:hypothetical protein